MSGTDTERAMRARDRLIVLAIGLLMAFMTLDRAGAADVCGVNEGVEAVFVQQMVEHGKLLFPLDNGTEAMYKPPLFHWTAAALGYLLDQRVVSTFSLRLPSALYATAGAVLIGALAMAVLGGRGAIIAGLAMAASYEYVSQGRIGRVDMTLTFFETLALSAFAWWLFAAAPRLSGSPARTDARRIALHYLIAAALGLGVLAKGPVGAMIPGAAIGLYLITGRRWDLLRDILKPGPIALGVALASSWYLACLIGRRYAFLDRQIVSENFSRFLGALGHMPIGYYVQPLLLNSGPLSLIAPFAVFAALARKDTDEIADRGEADRRGDRCARLFAIFWIVTIVFFELAAYKRKAYLLPMWPASSFLIAWWIVRRAPARTGAIAGGAVIAVCAVMIVVNFFFIPWYEVRDCGGKLSMREALAWPIESIAGEKVPIMQRDSMRRAAGEIARAVEIGAPLHIFGMNTPVEPLIFYMRRDAPPLATSLAAAPAGYVIVPGELWEKEKGQLPNMSLKLNAPYDDTYLALLNVRAPEPRRSPGAGH
ncbi:MAG TPA: glycosyltransferase family 39 protein [Candidatus Binataceae bacterium]|nr:glycosyltransferase family 39 protein [Candidatus Binataceae bacterium]